MNELVYLKNDEAVCDSLQVAEKFGKRHDKLIAEIRRMYGELIGKRGVQNGGAKFFFESTYENRGKRYPMFLMTRDGFSLLVMGFTGKEALEWKLQYIRAFNQMENFIREKSTQMWIESIKGRRSSRSDAVHRCSGTGDRRSKYSSCNRDYRRSQETARGSKGRGERMGRKLEYVS